MELDKRYKVWERGKRGKEMEGLERMKFLNLNLGLKTLIESRVKRKALAEHAPA
jgi:hypothetical protein